MTEDLKDQMDRLMDEALASMVSGEPRRVTAESVRQGIDQVRRPGVPIWMALAALLIVGLAITLRPSGPSGERPRPVANSAIPGVSTEAPRASSLPASSVDDPSRFVTVVPRVRQAIATETPLERGYEGLPRLTIASIDLPEPLSLNRLEADAIQIARIDIAPLTVSRLSNEQDHY